MLGPAVFNTKDSIVNEETKQKLSELVGYLADSVKDGGEFVKEQAPLAAQELVAFGRAYHTSVVCLAIVFVVAYLCLVLPRCVGAMKQLESELVFGFGLILSLAGAIASVFAGIALCHNFQPMLMAYFAPRLFILDYVKGLL